MMKRFLVFALAVLTVCSLFACSGNNGEVVVEDGLKLAGRQAGNEAVYYTFTYPEEWSMIRNDGVIELQYDCNQSDMVAEFATITTLVFQLSENGMGAKDYWASQKPEHEGLFQEYKDLDEKETELGGTVALKVKYSGKMNGRTYVSEQIICCRGSEVYLVTLVAPADYHDSVSNALEEVRKNFKYE